MHFVRKIVAVGLAVTVLTSGTGAIALAAPPADTANPPGRYSVRCDEGTCTVKTSLPGMSELAKAGAGAVLSAIQRQPNALPAGASVSVDDDLEIKLPVGELKLLNARILLDLGPDKQIERLHGTAEVPFPSFGVLNDVAVTTPAQAEVGLDIGKNLSYLNAPLEADRRYLFFTIGSGFDVAAKTDTATKQFEISVPAGQSATLVIDTQEPLVYLAGNFTVNRDDPIALMGKVLEPVQSLGVIPQALPSPSSGQRTQLAVSAQFGKQPQDQQVSVGAAHTVDAGIIGEWLGVDVQPLAVEGLLTVTREGMTLNGVASSNIAPDLILDAGVQVDAFIPFGDNPEDAYVLIQAQAAVPVAKIMADATAKVTWPLDVEATAHVLRPASDDSASSRATEDDSELLPTIKQTLSTAGDWAAKNVRIAGDAAARGSKWIASSVGAGYATISQHD